MLWYLASFRGSSGELFPGRPRCGHSQCLQLPATWEPRTGVVWRLCWDRLRTARQGLSPALELCGLFLCSVLMQPCCMFLQLRFFA